MSDDFITIGDQVYIGGLFGEDFEDINNKIGFIKKIIAASNKTSITYIADVVIDDTIIPINFDFLYKIDDDYRIDSILSNFDVVTDILYRLDVSIYNIGVDGDTGFPIILCETTNKKYEILTGSMLN